MREIRLYGSEGGGAGIQTGPPYPYQRLGIRVSQSVGDGAQDPRLRRPGVLALPQAAFERAISLVAGRQERGNQDAGGPSDASSPLGRKSRSHPGGAGMAFGRTGGLTRPFFGWRPILRTRRTESWQSDLGVFQEAVLW